MGEKCTGKTDDGECCGGCHHHEEVDVSSLGPEAVELAKKFEKVNDGLIAALQARQEILQMLHEKAAESPEMKEKMDKVLHSRHPVLLQFVFGSGPE